MHVCAYVFSSLCSVLFTEKAINHSVVWPTQHWEQSTYKLLFPSGRADVLMNWYSNIFIKLMNCKINITLTDLTLLRFAYRFVLHRVFDLNSIHRSALFPRIHFHTMWLLNESFHHSIRLISLYFIHPLKKNASSGRDDLTLHTQRLVSQTPCNKCIQPWRCITENRSFTRLHIDI